MRRDYWTLERVKEGLRRALTQLERGNELTEAALREAAKADKSIPHPSAVGRVATKHNTSFGSPRDAIVAERRRG